MLTDIKLSKASLSKIIQLDRFLGNMIGKSVNKELMDVAIPSTKDALLKLVSNVASNAASAASNAINKFERKISGKTATRSGKGFTLFILTEDIDDIIKIVDSLEKPDLLIDVATVTVKQNKKQEHGFLGAMMECMAASLIAPMTSLFI